MIDLVVSSDAALKISLLEAWTTQEIDRQKEVLFARRYHEGDQDAELEAMRAELERSYRATAKGYVEGIEVEIKRDKDDLQIQLKGFLAAIQNMRDAGPKRRN